jgi:hypothetical protein
MHKLSLPCLKIVNRILLQQNRCLKVSSPVLRSTSIQRSGRIERAKTLESANTQPYAAASVCVGRADSGIPAHLASARIDGARCSSCPAGRPQADAD